MVSAGMVGNIVSKLIISTLSDRIGSYRSSMCMVFVNALYSALVIDLINLVIMFVLSRLQPKANAVSRS